MPRACVIVLDAVGGWHPTSEPTVTRALTASPGGSLSALFFVTVVGIPLAAVLAVLAMKALSAPC